MLVTGLKILIFGASGLQIPMNVVNVAKGQCNVVET